MEIRFSQPAEAEIEETYCSYERTKTGLGNEFAAEVERALERIEEFPKAWTPVSKRSRRCRVHRFPYGILYEIRDEAIVVIAVMHMSRDPRTWLSRLEE